MLEDATMPRVKQASKKKQVTRAAVPALGAAGLTFSMAGSAFASAVPIADTPQTPNLAPGHMFTLGEEELSDVSLATFHLVDKDTIHASGILLARACGGCGGRGCGGARGCGGGFRGCGGCRGCAGCRGCRSCRCGIGIGCGGCGVGLGLGWGLGCSGCCASWGACRWC